eukprot:977377_1
MKTFLALSLGCLRTSFGSQLTVFNIDTTNPGPSLIDEFLSVTIDAGLANHFNDFDFSSPLVNTLATGLSPLFFRYGGTSGDETIYDLNGDVSHKTLSEQTLNWTEFSTIADFAQNNNWKFIFGLNAQQRFQNNNSWNPTNSRALMKKIIDSGRYSLVSGYELGNEPDLYYKNGPRGMVNVSAQQLAKDVQTLYDLIHDDVYHNIDYKPFIWGCDIASQFNYLQSFLNHSSPKTVSGVTWHHYYGKGSEWTLSDFISVHHLDTLISRINESTQIVNDNHMSLNILGETSSTYGGGTANLSTSFAAGFLWLDKLGLSSALGLYAVARQDFWGGHYGLIGSSDFAPNPDYWSSYLFKNLVGSYVLMVENGLANGRSIRAYAYCTRSEKEGSVFDYGKGSVTVMVLNMQNNTIAFELNLKGVVAMDGSMSYDQYLLTSYPGVLQSRDVLLNGQVLQMVDDKTFPVLKPNIQPAGSVVAMEALSYGYVVVVNANATACL